MSDKSAQKHSAAAAHDDVLGSSRASKAASSMKSFGRKALNASLLGLRVSLVGVSSYGALGLGLMIV